MPAVRKSRGTSFQERRGATPQDRNPLSEEALLWSLCFIPESAVFILNAISHVRLACHGKQERHHTGMLRRPAGPRRGR